MSNNACSNLSLPMVAKDQHGQQGQRNASSSDNSAAKSDTTVDERLSYFCGKLLGVEAQEEAHTMKSDWQMECDELILLLKQKYPALAGKSGRDSHGDDVNIVSMVQQGKGCLETLNQTEGGDGEDGASLWKRLFALCYIQ